MSCTTTLHGEYEFHWNINKFLQLALHLVPEVAKICLSSKAIIDTHKLIAFTTKLHG